MDYKCLKCGSEKFQVKNVVFPEKGKGLVGFDVGLYYFKICNNCGYTEIYSGKILDKEKDEKLVFGS